MEWLWENPIAEMAGPKFLLLYACVSAAAVVVCRLAVRGLDWTGRLPPPPVPSAPDPYEIAYLRGGENEVTRAGIFSLIKRGLLSFSRQGKKVRIERTNAGPPRNSHGQIERRIYDWFDRPRESGEVFRGGGLAQSLRGLCAGYEQALRRDQLLTPPSVKGGAWTVRLAGLAVIAGLGGYKLLVALSKGRFNVGFLVVLCVVAIVVLLAATRTPRISRRGRAHLERLRLAFERLKGGGPSDAWRGYEDASGALLSHGAAAGQGATARAVDPSLVVLGVFGASALAAADYENYKAAFQRSSAGTGDASSCGGGCGSSDSSSGSDSGSSCGGGGCGGGCGGCGGD